VMQFNESHQRRKLEERLRLEKEMQGSDTIPKSDSDEMPKDKQTGQPTSAENKLP